MCTDEQEERFPAPSVPLAYTSVDESSATEIPIPLPTNAARVPVASELAPVQLGSLYRRTLTTSASAVPLTNGLLSFAGDTGVVAVGTGASGASVSTVNSNALA